MINYPIEARRLPPPLPPRSIRYVNNMILLYRPRKRDLNAMMFRRRVTRTSSQIYSVARMFFPALEYVVVERSFTVNIILIYFVVLHNYLYGGNAACRNSREMNIFIYFFFGFNDDSLFVVLMSSNHPWGSRENSSFKICVLLLLLLHINHSSACCY